MAAIDQQERDRCQHQNAADHACHLLSGVLCGFAAGRFMTTNPAWSRYRASVSAAIRAMPPIAC